MRHGCICTHAGTIRVARNVGMDEWVLAGLSAVCGWAQSLAVERFALACGGRAVPCKADGAASCWRAARVSRLKEAAYTLTPARSPALPHVPPPLLLALCHHHHYYHYYHYYSCHSTHLPPLLLAVCIIAIPPLHWRLSLLLLRFLQTRRCIRIPASNSLIIKCKKPRHTLPASKRAQYPITAATAAAAAAAIVHARLHSTLPLNHALLLLRSCMHICVYRHVTHSCCCQYGGLPSLP